MNTNYPCQCCKDDYTGEACWAPSGVKLGRSVLMKMVCKDCQAEHLDGLNTEIWKDSTHLHTTRCNMCGGGFGTDGPYYAHRRPLATGEWVLAPVCSGCFAGYQACCTKLMSK